MPVEQKIYQRYCEGALAWSCAMRLTCCPDDERMVAGIVLQSYSAFSVMDYMQNPQDEELSASGATWCLSFEQFSKELFLDIIAEDGEYFSPVREIDDLQGVEGMLNVFSHGKRKMPKIGGSEKKIRKLDKLINHEYMRWR